MTGFERGDVVEAAVLGMTLRGRLLSIDWEDFPATATIHTMSDVKAKVAFKSLTKVLPPPVTRKEKP